MSEYILYALVILCLIVLAIAAALFVRSRGASKQNSVIPQTQAEPLPQSPLQASTVTLEPEFIVADEGGRPWIQSRLITQIPAEAPTFSEPNSIAVKRGQQLAADLFKGVATLPNTTLELVFDPEIQKGLREGILTIMNAKGGGQRAMAIAGDGKIAGHARIIEGGKARQLASGAFHLLSIAVAQSHLADINKSLADIQGAIERLHRTIDDKDHAQLRGSVSYLEYLVGFMQDLGTPEEFPQEKRNQLEAIKHQTMQWIEQLLLEAIRLKSDISQQKEVDTFGTGATFTALEVHANNVTSLLQKRDVLLRILALLDIGTAYLDPVASGKWTLSLKEKFSQSFQEIDALLVIQRDRSFELLSKAVWNRQKTLEERRDGLVRKNEEQRALTLEHHKAYSATAELLAQQLKKYRTDSQPVRTALTFDQHGQVSKVSVL
ncbi:hypothetical protein [Pseudomonas cedrina]|uniref:hypothetical protein n=1 Tax=Pseudomonas cedrina TaxID=651740 RepID=UPI002786EDBD|nr:hypothetical protein [Pseudomonas cedrina]MDQ0652099.1 hypothetical protein [Pseudomonas cedrina]